MTAYRLPPAFQRLAFAGLVLALAGFTVQAVIITLSAVRRLQRLPSGEASLAEGAR